MSDHTNAQTKAKDLRQKNTFAQIEIIQKTKEEAGQFLPSGYYLRQKISIKIVDASAVNPTVITKYKERLAVDVASINAGLMFYLYPEDIIQTFGLSDQQLEYVFSLLATKILVGYPQLPNNPQFVATTQKVATKTSVKYFQMFEDALLNRYNWIEKQKRDWD